MTPIPSLHHYIHMNSACLPSETQLRDGKQTLMLDSPLWEEKLLPILPGRDCPSNCFSLIPTLPFTIRNFQVLIFFLIEAFPSPACKRIRSSMVACVTTSGPHLVSHLNLSVKPSEGLTLPSTPAVTALIQNLLGLFL